MTITPNCSHSHVKEQARTKFRMKAVSALASIMDGLKVQSE